MGGPEPLPPKKSLPHRILVGVDQFFDVLTGGENDETISARSQRAADRGNKFGRFMTWWLGKIQRGHGKRAEAGDLARAERVEDIEAGALGEQPK